MSGVVSPSQCRADFDALSRAVLAITEQTSIHEVLQMIVESARNLVRADYAALGLRDEQARFAEFYASGITSEQWTAIGPVPRAHGLLGLLLRQTKPHRTADVRADARFSGWPSAHPDMGPFLGIPVVDRGDILGAIYVANRPDGRQFEPADERMLRILAAHAAIAITRAKMFERDRELTVVEERARIARDLHDAVAQKLFSLRLTVGAVEALLLKGDRERARDEFARLKELVGSALDELRAVVTELRPPAVREDGLVPALRKHVDVIGRAHPVDVSFSADCDGRCALPEAVEDAVFRVAQEALHNALRHAEPRHVVVNLRTPKDRVILTVSDDGKGLAREPAREGGHHLGIASMRERARRVGGRLRVESRVGEGTTVTLEVPRD